MRCFSCNQEQDLDIDSIQNELGIVLPSHLPCFFVCLFVFSVNLLIGGGQRIPCLASTLKCILLWRLRGRDCEKHALLTKSSWNPLKGQVRESLHGPEYIQENNIGKRVDRCSGRAKGAQGLLWKGGQPLPGKMAAQTWVCQVEVGGTEVST